MLFSTKAKMQIESGREPEPAGGGYSKGVLLFSNTPFKITK